MSKTRFVVGIDLGGTKISAGAMSADGSREFGTHTVLTRAEQGADGRGGGHFAPDASSSLAQICGSHISSLGLSAAAIAAEGVNSGCGRAPSEAAHAHGDRYLAVAGRLPARSGGQQDHRCRNIHPDTSWHAELLRRGIGSAWRDNPKWSSCPNQASHGSIC